MAKSEKRGIGSTIFGLINPLRDPSMLIAVILTVIAEGGNSDSWYKWLIFFLLFWVAVKAVIWLLVNFAFSFVYLVRKTGWVIRNPRLAWRLLDALGTEEIIIGGLRPDMFATEEGGLHGGEMGLAALGVAYAQGYGPGGPNGGYLEDGYGRQPVYSRGLDFQSQEVQELLSAYSRLINDWMGFTEEKWRAVSDSQLGWKPLRGRWSGWDEIYRDSFGADGYSGGVDPVIRRYESSHAKGSAASAVACFMRDLEQLRQALLQMEGGEVGDPRAGVMSQHMTSSQRSAKGPIIRNPMIVDADR
jgi:hypothetical protein